MPEMQLSTTRAAAGSICQALNLDSYLVYATSTREPFVPLGLSVEMGAISQFARILRKMGKVNKLALIIHTNGGDMSAPWPIVSLIREYCDELTIIIAGRALSAGTLISIAGDKIVMNPDSFLSPVDPRTVLSIKGEMQNVEVEDVTAYIDFVKNRVGLLGGSGLENAFQGLTEEVSATRLGSMYRTHSLIRSLAAKMLDTRKNKIDSRTEQMIVGNLAEKLFSHSHLISRHEAQDYVGLGKVINLAAGDIEEKIEKVRTEFVNLMKMEDPFDPIELLGSTDGYSEELTKGVICSSDEAALFKSTLSIKKLAPQQINVNALDKGWAKE